MSELLLRRREMMGVRKPERNSFIDYSGAWLTVQNNVFTEVNPTRPSNRNQYVEIKIPIEIKTDDIVGILFRGEAPDYGAGKTRDYALVDANKSTVITLVSNGRPSANHIITKTATADGVAHYLVIGVRSAATGTKTYTTELYLNGTQII